MNRSSRFLNLDQLLDREGRSAWRGIRLIVEVALVFVLLFWLDRAWMSNELTARLGFHPYTLVVLFFAVKNGLPGGLLATVLAMALWFLQPGIAESTPLTTGNPDFFAQRFDRYRLPLIWLLAATVLGILVSRREVLYARLQDQFQALLNDASIVHSALQNSLARTDALERQIASEQQTFGGLMMLMPRLQRSAGNRQRLVLLHPALERHLDTRSLEIFVPENGRFRQLVASSRRREQQADPLHEDQTRLDSSLASVNAGRTDRPAETARLIARVQHQAQSRLHALLVMESVRDGNTDNIQQKLTMTARRVAMLLDQMATHPTNTALNDAGTTGQPRTAKQQPISTGEQWHWLRQRKPYDRARCRPKYELVSANQEILANPSDNRS